jgi:hypothetical protein
MTTRADYSTPEWNTLQTAILGCAFYIRKLAPNFIDGWRAERAAISVIDDEETYEQDVFFEQLCDTAGYKTRIPDYLPRTPDVMEVPILQAIAESINILQAKDPQRIAMFKSLIEHIASVAAESDTEVSPEEQHAVNKIREALNNPDEFGNLADMIHPYSDN